MPPLPVPAGSAQLAGVELTDELKTALASANAYMDADMAANTRRAYEANWRAFETWCGKHSLSALPAADATLAAYLAGLADAKLAVSTIDQHAAAIAWRHRGADLVPPNASRRVKRVQRGIRRTLGSVQHAKAPITALMLRKLLKALFKAAPDKLVGKRDHALMLIGFAGAFRRSELVAIVVADLEWTPDGVIVTIRKSKGDQEGRGQTVSIPNGKKFRPVEALRAWLDATGIQQGPVFRPVDKAGNVGAKALTGQSVALIVKRWAKAAGLDPDLFAGHSLRSGLITQALIDEIDVLQIMDVSRHKEVKTLKKYDRRVKSFKQHALRKSL